MKQAQLGELRVGRLGLGAMGMSVAYAGAAATTPNRSAPSIAPSTWVSP